MEERLKELYELELRHLESHAADFAATEKLRDAAGRLGLGEGEQVRDPFVEWLLQGSAFLAARVQHTIESEFPRFTGAMLDIVFPHLAAPTPAMLIAQFGFSGVPGAATLGGPIVPKGLQLGMPIKAADRSDRRKGFPDAVFTTGRSVRLWPASVAEAEYLPDPAGIAGVTGGAGSAAAGVRVTLRLEGEGTFADTTLDTMDIHFAGGAVGARLMEAIAFGGARAAVVQGAEKRRGTRQLIPIDVAPLGFDGETMVEGVGMERDALLPYDRRSFDGYRLLHEYFALPERFRFIRLSGLRKAFGGVGAGDATLVFLFDRPHEGLAGQVGAEAIKLNCVPAVNLFAKDADNIALDLRRAEQEMVADRDQPTAYEIHSITRVTGRLNNGGEVRFRPFFSTGTLGSVTAAERREDLYYVAARHPRSRSRTLKGDEETFVQSGYRGSDMFLSFVDAEAKPAQGSAQSAYHALRSIQIETLCTNRLLPTLLRSGDTALTIRGEAGGDVARIIGRPSPPRTGVPEGRRQWDVVSHLSLNHLSLQDTEAGAPVEALRQLLRLYAPRARRGLIDGLRRVSATPVVGRAPAAAQVDGRPLPVVFTRGVEVALRFDPTVEEAPMLSAILERFFAGYAPVSAFTRTVLLDEDEEARLRWPTRTGLMKVL